MKNVDFRKFIKIRSLLFFVSFSICYLSTSTNMHAIDWTWYTPEPAACDASDTNAWVGPQEFIYCAGDPVYPMNGCDPNCCFKIIFYDRWCGPTRHNYEMAVVGIFYYSGTNCDQCDRYSILWNANLSRIHNMTMSDESFVRNLLNGRPPGPWEFIYFNMFTDAICMDGSDTCSWVCCRTNYRSLYGGYGHGTYEVWGQEFEGNFYEPECNYPCTPTCYQAKMDTVPTPSISCDLDCDNGSWTTFTNTITVSLPGCTGCDVQIWYRKKTSNCPPNTFTDLVLDSIHQTSACTCYISTTDIYKYAEQYVLQYVGINEVPSGQCKENIRMFRSSCWHSGQIFFPPNPQYYYIWTPCFEGCCWARYKICHNSPTGINSITLLEKSSIGTACTQASNPCSNICDVDVEINWFPKYSIENIDFLDESLNNSYSYCIPNPAEDNFDIHFISNDKGNVNLKIFDVLGNMVYQADKSKNTGELIITIKNSKLFDGQYYYQLLINNNLEGKGSIQIIH